jgi:hypothetical protein
MAWVKKQGPISKTTTAGGMDQVGEHLPNKHKALILNPSTMTKKKKENW